jgi:hypothetical protein
VPNVIESSGIALVACATPIPLPEGAPVFQPENPGVERRSLLLCFLDQEPSEAWDSFSTLALAVAAGGQGTVSYAAPFIPTIPGTDTYTDQLW